MTFYYLLHKENLIDVENLAVPNNGYVFINNLNNGEGFENKMQYELENNIIKIFTNNKTGTNMVHDIINDKYYERFTKI